MDGDRRITFNARTDDDIDGFEFKVTGRVESLRFVARVRGSTRRPFGQSHAVGTQGRFGADVHDLPFHGGVTRGPDFKESAVRRTATTGKKEGTTGAVVAK